MSGKQIVRVVLEFDRAGIGGGDVTVEAWLFLEVCERLARKVHGLIVKNSYLQFENEAQDATD